MAHKTVPMICKLYYTTEKKIIPTTVHQNNLCRGLGSFDSEVQKGTLSHPHPIKFCIHFTAFKFVYIFVVSSRLSCLVLFIIVIKRLNTMDKSQLGKRVAHSQRR